MKPLRIMIVEDEVLLAMDLEQIVVDAGSAVVGIASTSAEARRLAADHKPHLALVDIHLSDGLTGTRIVQFLSSHTLTKSVFMTANAGRVPADGGGAIGTIAKPYGTIGVHQALMFLAEALLDPPIRTQKPQALWLCAPSHKLWLP